MLFKVLPPSKVFPPKINNPENEVNTAFLVTDNWDDFGFKTQFFLVYIDIESKQHDIGSLKIGQFRMHEEQRRPEIAESFDFLDDNFFSIGQDESYYIKLNELGSETREEILIRLQDLAIKPSKLRDAISEHVMTTSLLRYVGLQSIRGRFHRLATGNSELTPYKFSYISPKPDNLKLTFEVKPESEPPTNIHVLIGRNGVGKTYCLTMMTLAVISNYSPELDVGIFQADSSNQDGGLFENLISVSFSAFDPFELLPLPKSRSVGVRYSYVGLKQFDKKSKSWMSTPKDLEALTKEFVTSMEACRRTGKLKRWGRALEILSTDPTFEDIRLLSVQFFDGFPDWKDDIGQMFGKLSSGHKIVLLTITRLLEDVTERTLVLIDEPEAHLHPPLLSAFIRAISDLLIQQNGVGIIATHSPVVLQEIPKSCVWIIRRSGLVSKVERPESETFGENLGVLTREIFGLEVTEAGFHRMLKDVIDEHQVYDEVIEHFDGQLGAEAKAIVRALMASKKNKSNLK